MAFPKRRESEKAAARWPGDLIENQRKEWVPTTDKHKALHQAAALNGAEGGGASVLSVPERHARTAVFLRKGWGWGDTNQCWCQKRRQSREHLFKECTT